MHQIHELRNFQHGFDTPVGQLATTCRLGTKWSKVPPGDTLFLFRCDTPQPPEPFGMVRPLPEGVQDCGCGEVVGHWVGAFRKIPDALLAIEHEASCRDRDVLAATMEKAYGGLFGPDETVTMLLYLRLSDGANTDPCRREAACCSAET